MTATPPSNPPRGLTRQDVFSALGALGAILTLVTAVLFYFGWRRSDVQAREMSIDVSLFGYSSQDYVLRSISSLYLPLLMLFGAGLGGLWLHVRVVQLLRSDLLASRGRRAAATACASRISVAGVVVASSCLLFAVVAGMSSPPVGIGWLASLLRNRQWVVPLVLVAATLSAAYFRWIHQQLEPPPVSDAAPLLQTLLPAILVAGTVVLGAFWILEEYASAVSRG